MGEMWVVRSTRNGRLYSSNRYVARLPISEPRPHGGRALARWGLAR